MMTKLASINRSFCRQSCLVPLAVALLTLFFCEFLIYRVVIGQCSWPDGHSPGDSSGDHGTGGSHSETVYALILADTHLLGLRRGHWFDKLRREWQMRQSFNAALSRFRPDVVFVLGDLFDEGQWAGKGGIDEYTKQFHDIFRVPPDMELYATVGNHDIGFHDVRNDGAFEEFQENFGSGSVRLVIVKRIPFVLVNSMAMDTDKCDFCLQAERELMAINRTLACSMDPARAESEFGTSCRDRPLLDYAAPVLMHHFPLYRKTEALCEDGLPDSAPEVERDHDFRPYYSSMSADASSKLLTVLRPRAVFSGHTHFHCVTKHGNILEHNVASFNWRNLNSPTFFLAKFTPENYKVQKCYLPYESTVITIYFCVAASLMFWIVFCCCRRTRAASLAFNKIS